MASINLHKGAVINGRGERERERDGLGPIIFPSGKAAGVVCVLRDHALKLCLLCSWKCLGRTIPVAKRKNKFGKAGRWRQQMQLKSHKNIPFFLHRKKNAVQSKNMSEFFPTFISLGFKNFLSLRRLMKGEESGEDDGDWS